LHTSERDRENGLYVIYRGGKELKVGLLKKKCSIEGRLNKKNMRELDGETRGAFLSCSLTDQGIGKKKKERTIKERFS